MQRRKRFGAREEASTMPSPTVRCALAALLVTLLSTPALAQTIIIDNTDSAPNFIATGNDWATWGMWGSGFDGSDTDYLYTSHTVGGSDRRGQAIWSPDIPTEGRYRIATWFRRTSNRTTDADFIVMDGVGDEQKIVLNQRGDGPSGWVGLGTYWCAEGRDGCRVTLDANDDDQSDEANAVRFRRVGDAPPPEDPDPEPPVLVDCTTPLPGGDHVQQGFATVVRGDDWTRLGRATGAPDGRGAHTRNMDAGEWIRARGWTVCDPLGADEITSVRLSVRARTQYDSGSYDILVRLDGGGEARRLWHDTSYGWRTVDLTDDRDSWTWEDVAALRAEMRLHSHPNGRRDSDVWADAFRLRVGFGVFEVMEAAEEEREEVEVEPSECEGECADGSDWWWDDPGDGANADDLPDDDVDELDGLAAEDDEPAFYDEDEPVGADDADPGDDDLEDETPADNEEVDASELQSDDPAWSGGGTPQGCATDSTGWTTAALMPLALVGLLGLRRR